MHSNNSQNSSNNKSSKRLTSNSPLVPRIDTIILPSQHKFTKQLRKHCDHQNLNVLEVFCFSEEDASLYKVTDFIEQQAGKIVIISDRLSSLSYVFDHISVLDEAIKQGKVEARFLAHNLVINAINRQTNVQWRIFMLLSQIYSEANGGEIKQEHIEQFAGELKEQVKDHPELSEDIREVLTISVECSKVGYQVSLQYLQKGLTELQDQYHDLLNSLLNESINLPEYRKQRLSLIAKFEGNMQIIAEHLRNMCYFCAKVSDIMMITSA